MEITTIGLTAKQVFQLHGVDAHGREPILRASSTLTASAPFAASLLRVVAGGRKRVWRTIGADGGGLGWRMTFALASPRCIGKLR